jgi:phage terminase large subunit GpA-like protein
MRSYHIPALLSPRGFKSWESGVLDFLQIKSEGFDKMKFQNWTNTFLGEPFVDEGEKPKIETILTTERRYRAGTLPEDARPLFVTVGADVQADRIECEIVAWGENKESWSINYHVIPAENDTSDIDDVCWTSLKSIIKTKYAGLPVVLAGVDSGFRTETVYQFCDQFDTGVYATKGQETLDRGYIKAINIQGRDNARIDINTNLLKQEVYRALGKVRFEDGRFPKEYCHFPADYTREHYNRLTAESRIMEVVGGVRKFRWDAGSRRNEQLDCRVINLAMVYAYNEAVKDAQGLDDLSWADFWSYLTSNE